MKKIIVILIAILGLSCKNRVETPSQSIAIAEPVPAILGTWKLIYGETKEKDSVKIKDLSKVDFIKIINEDHFAFFNQPKEGGEGFYGGGGPYILEGNSYTEVLDYVGFAGIRGHKFPFTIEIKGDTLVQSGIEDVPEAGIKRHIVEKYIKVE